MSYQFLDDLRIAIPRTGHPYFVEELMPNKLKRSITQSNLQKYVLFRVVEVHPDVDASLLALAETSAQAVLDEHKGTVGVEPIAAEWARHAELKSVAAAARKEEGLTTTLALETIGKLAAARAEEEGPRLALIQKLAAWTPESSENIEQLIAEANQPELPLTFEQGWLRAANHYSSLRLNIDEQQELAKRVWNFAIDSCLATAQPVAEEMMDSLDALRRDYVEKMGDRKDTALLERFEAAWQKLDVLSIPYAALNPVIKVFSEMSSDTSKQSTFVVKSSIQETVLRVVRQDDAGSYVAVIQGKKQAA
jgi:hypothetical protein